MSLLELTVRNVKRNFRLYTIYLISMIAGVVIQFTFSSLMFNEDIMDALNSRANYQTGVAIASVAVFLFIIFFILYANSFFMKQRKKEFGMYLLYGLSERQVTRMVFYETLMLSAIALATGVLLGGLLSKLFGMLLMNLMRYDQPISLTFPISAIAITAGMFLLLTVIVSVQNHIMVNRVQLTELFHAKAKADKPVRTSTAMALLAVLLLVVAFILIGSGRGSVFWQEYATASMFVSAIGVIAGTYLIFRQFAGWLLQTIARRRTYHEGDTVLWTSSLRFQVRGNTLNLTFIALFSAAIMMLLSFVTINYKVQFDAVGMNLPNDIAFQSLDRKTNAEIDELIAGSEHPVRYHVTHETIVAAPLADRGLAFENPEMYTAEVYLVPERSYNELVRLRGDGRRSVELQGDEAVSLSQGSDFARPYGEGERVGFAVRAGEETTLRLVEKKDYAYLGWSSDPVRSMGIKPAVLVVSDERYDALREGADKRSFELYALEDARTAEELSARVHAIVARTPDAYYSSFADVYSKQIESSSLMLFASGFLALIATFALASVIYFKQLREATDERQQFAILRKIGVGDRQLKSVIRKKLLFVFVPPLALGMLISWTIIKSYILDSVRDFPELPGLTLGIMGVYVFIYLLFYASSANLYYKIASEKV